MTEITKEKAVELIAGRIEDEFRKHGSGNVDWQKVAASKVYTQWFEHFQSELSKQKKLLLQKDEENSKTIEIMFNLQEEINALQEEIEALKKEVNEKTSLAMDYRNQIEDKNNRIKELERGLKTAKIRFENLALGNHETVSSSVGEKEIDDLLSNGSV